jgi:hypothetical protein
MVERQHPEKWQNLDGQNILPIKGIFMIGKRIGGAVYAHIKYAAKTALDLGMGRRYYQAFKAQPPNFKATVIKFAKDKISLIECKDFDTASEPTVGRVIVIYFDENNKAMFPLHLPVPKDPWVYHGKEEMVGPDYAGFDRVKALMWHRKWKQYLKDNHISHTNIGKKSVWEEKVKNLK